MWSSTKHLQSCRTPSQSSPTPTHDIISCKHRLFGLSLRPKSLGASGSISLQDPLACTSSSSSHIQTQHTAATTSLDSRPPSFRGHSTMLMRDLYLHAEGTGCLVESVMVYGSELWAENKSKKKNKLQRVEMDCL
jgi:hypothetical protein